MAIKKPLSPVLRGLSNKRMYPLGVPHEIHKNKKAPPRYADGLFYSLVVNLLGFEPRLAESKSDVLPLHHKSIYNPFLNYDAKLRLFF